MKNTLFIQILFFLIRNMPEWDIKGRHVLKKIKKKITFCIELLEKFIWH